MHTADLSAFSLITSTRAFSATEQRIVDCIMANLDSAPTCTAAQLARKSGVSEATISRFCKRLGFENYRGFQYSLARDLARQNNGAGITEEISLDAMETSLQSILAIKTSELEATLRGLDTAVLHQVIELIMHADVIQIAAVGNTNSVALDAAFKFSQLGLRCMTHEVSEVGTGFALTLGKRDVLLVISNSGKSQRLARIAQAARNGGATVVLITSDESSPLARMADYVLRTVNHEALITTVDFTFSKISAMAIVEVLYYFMLASIEGAREHINSYEELIGPDKDVE